MDFFKILKGDVGLGMSNFDRLFAEKHGGGAWQLTTLTGTLPMTFRSNGTALVNYHIYGTVEGAGVQTENLCPTLSNWVDGYINPAGNITSPLPITLEKSSDFIEVSPNTLYTFCIIDGFPFIENNPAWRGIAYYDVDHAFISRVADYLTENLTNTTPVNAKYVRLTYRTYGQTNSPMLVEGSTAPPETYIPYGYKLPLTVKNSTETKTIDVYIGDSKLGEEEYVDYGEQKIYKRILFMTHDDKHFMTKDNKDFCLRRRGYSG